MPKKEKVLETPQDEEITTPSSESIKESKVVTAKTADLLEDDEARKRVCEPKGRFIAIALKGDRFRVVSKHKKWVSPILNYTEATRLAIALNRKDPEQKAINASAVKKDGGVSVSSWQDN